MRLTVGWTELARWRSRRREAGGERLYLCCGWMHSKLWFPLQSHHTQYSHLRGRIDEEQRNPHDVLAPRPSLPWRW